MSQDLSESCILKERQYSAHNYTPMPVVFARAAGCEVWDVDGNKYLDFGGSYCATNQGHNHPKIAEAVIDQIKKCCLPSRAFTHELFAGYVEYVCKVFGFEKCLPLNGGSEAIEFAIKLSRAWGYTKKGIEPSKAKVMFAANNYHGRTLGTTSASTNEHARKNYGPFIPNVGPWYGDGKIIRYNNIKDIEECFELEGENIAAIVLESIQGEAGIYVPEKGYLSAVKRLCEQYNILYIADEIQVGAGRTGKLLSYQHDGIQPDVLVVAKSISGGFYPTSLVLSSADIMDSIQPNSHGATFSGSPLSCRASKKALEVLFEEKMIENAANLETVLFKGLNEIKENSDVITDVRGRGLLAGFDVDRNALGEGKKVWHLCMLLRSKGVICKMVHDKTIRWSPALTITEEQLKFGLKCLEESVTEIKNISVAEIPDAIRYEYLCY
ncbi:AIS_collapsed_G0004830.mRNA.1.CDS.1 [Saccharomyces cerevisiae]|nr:AIS_HP1_G0004750.mRNA.1.CDS.1 [Saccharomyces cerevisiae]CAI6510968.1 AIS_collapsed_G0004830.mRNA.1.CDS.1 [Saccharomyces cerevisiae]